MSFSDVEYYFEHGIVDHDFMTLVLSEYARWFEIKFIQYAALFRFLLYILCVFVVEINVLYTLKNIFEKGVFSMNKKIVPLICLSLILCFCVPSVPALADDTLIPGYYTKDSIDGLFTGEFNGVDRSTVADLIYNSENGSFDYLDLLQSIDFSSYNNYSFFVYSPNSGSVNFQVVLIENMAGNNLPLVYYKNGYFGLVYPRIAPYNNTVHVFSRSNDGTISHSTTTASRVDPYFYGLFPLSGSPNASRLLYAYNIYGVYSSQELNTVVPSSSEDFVTLANDVYGSNTNGFTNYWSDTMPYYDGNAVVDPDAPVGESNLNHMYFNSCDFGFCEPINVNSFSNFGGAYFYAKYNVDDWVLNHIGDYKIEFHVDCYVGNQHFSFTTRQALDPDLVLTVPFSYFDGFNYGFSTYITNQKIDKSFLKTYLYCIKPEQYSSFYNKLNSAQSNDNLHNMLNELADNDLDFPSLFCYTNSNYTYLIKDEILTTEFLNQLFYNNSFTITCNARLFDESGNASGWVSREFDLVRGSSISTDNDGLTNENPFNDDSSDFLPDIPDNYDVIGTGINSLTGLSVYNMTPENIKLTIDNGLKDFVSWYNTDSSVGNAAHSFWNNMGIFENNPASSLYQQYFGFLPDDFKTLIFGACGIGIVGGAFCILRKKLT